MSFVARLGVVSLVALSMSSWSGWASSAEPTAAERGKLLFDEGRKAMEAKDYATACARFEASYVASGVPGSLLNWAECEETRGRVGTALALWRQGAAIVTREPEREEFVRQRIAALEPRAPKLLIQVAPGLAGVVVTVDGRPVADLKAPMPVDPGEHRVVARADGVAEEAHTVELAIGGSKSLAVLRDAAPPRSAPARPTIPPKQAEAEDGGAAWIVGGVVAGGVGIGAMIGFGVTAGMVVGECGESLDPCAGDRDTVEGLNVANGVLLGVGAAGLLTGTVLIIVGATQGGDDAGPTVALAPLPGGAFAGFSTSF